VTPPLIGFLYQKTFYTFENYTLSMVFKLSPSGLKVFEECSRCFWLNHNKVWVRPKGIFPSLPGGMDAVIKQHFDAFRSKNELPPELKDEPDIKDTKLFSDQAKLDDWRKNTGIKIEDQEGNILQGGVDDILIKNDKLIVLDYKTRRSPPKEDTIELYKLQQNAYNYMLRKLGEKTEDYYFLLFYWPEKINPSGEIKFKTQLIKQPVNTQIAENTFKNAIKLLKNECPTNTCKWCENVKNE